MSIRDILSKAAKIFQQPEAASDAVTDFINDIQDPNPAGHSKYLSPDSGQIFADFSVIGVDKGVGPQWYNVAAPNVAPIPVTFSKNPSSATTPPPPEPETSGGGCSGPGCEP